MICAEWKVALFYYALRTRTAALRNQRFAGNQSQFPTSPTTPPTIKTNVRPSLSRCRAMSGRAVGRQVPETRLLKCVDLGLERDDLDLLCVALDLESINDVVFLAEFDNLAGGLAH